MKKTNLLTALETIMPGVESKQSLLVFISGK